MPSCVKTCLCVFQELKTYLNERNSDFIFKEEQRNKQLIKKTRIKLINHVKDFIMDKISKNPTKDEIKTVCLATIELFPSLRARNSEIDGIVSL